MRAVIAQLEGGALGSAAGRYVGVQMTNLDAVQGTVLLVSAVVCAAGNAAFDTGVCIFVIHFTFLLFWSAISRGEREENYSQNCNPVQTFCI